MLQSSSLLADCLHTEDRPPLDVSIHPCLSLWVANYSFHFVLQSKTAWCRRLILLVVFLVVGSDRMAFSVSFYSLMRFQALFHTISFWFSYPPWLDKYCTNSISGGVLIGARCLLWETSVTVFTSNTFREPFPVVPLLCKSISDYYSDLRAFAYEIKSK